MRISKTNNYWWPVEFCISEEDDTVSKVTCELLFKRVTKDEATAIFVKSRESDAMDISTCRAIVSKWRNFVDSDGATIEWSSEAFEEAIKYTQIAADIVREWIRSLSESGRKNS